MTLVSSLPFFLLLRHFNLHFNDMEGGGRGEKRERGLRRGEEKASLLFLFFADRPQSENSDDDRRAFMYQL